MLYGLIKWAMADLRFAPSFVLGIGLWLALCVASAAQMVEDDGQPRILAIYSDTSTLTANIGVADGLRETLDTIFEYRYELYTEFRAIQEFAAEAEDNRFIEMLERKYSNRSVDAVLAIGPAALRLVLAHRERFAPGRPVVAAAVTDSLYETPLPDDVHVVLSVFDLEGTVSLARRVQPDARRLVVFTGSAPFDDNWQAFARDALANESGLDIDFVSGLTLAEFEEAAARLDADTILLILTIFEDASGARFIPANAANEIAARSAAPTWAVYQTFLDNGDGGVVGGLVQPFEEIGRKLGDLAGEVLSGTVTGSTVVPVTRLPVVDWDEFRRYGLDLSLLPDNAVLIDYDPTIWERYRLVIFAVLAVVLAQTATIAALVVQGRRWQASQREVTEQQLELARLSRVSQLGALSGAITHELNQPLTAILADAEAGARLIRRSPPDIEAVAEILGDIASEDRRAAKIISDLRNLMSRRAVEPTPVDLNDVATSVARLTNSEAVMRDVRVTVRTAPRPLVVLGDSEQFRQIVLNLMLNSMDAMNAQTPESRTLTIETARLADGRYAIMVQDNGPGLAREVADDPFQPFVTTKAGGLGMGLAICRTIAEAHHGTLDFVPTARGSRAVLALPPA